LATPELIVSPKALESRSEAKVRYLVTFTLVYWRLFAKKAHRLALLTPIVIAILLTLLAGAWYFLQVPSFWVILVGLTVILLAVAVAWFRTWRWVVEAHLGAIEISGDVTSALKVMRGECSQKLSFMPAFLNRWEDRRREKDIRQLEERLSSLKSVIP
jgi:hypothetical protein